MGNRHRAPSLPGTGFSGGLADAGSCVFSLGFHDGVLSDAARITAHGAGQCSDQKCSSRDSRKYAELLLDAGSAWQKPTLENGGDIPGRLGSSRDRSVVKLVET